MSSLHVANISTLYSRIGGSRTLILDYYFLPAAIEFSLEILPEKGSDHQFTVDKGHDR
jgi:hypothetical protein